MSDEINHPAHYGGDGPYEVIKVIEEWNLGFNLGNCVKYIARAGKKFTVGRKQGPGNNVQAHRERARLQDLKKARWYLDHEIQSMEKE